MSEIYELIQWPAIIKLHADDELIFVPNAVQFVSDVVLHLTHVQARDMLITAAALYIASRIAIYQSLFAPARCYRLMKWKNYCDCIILTMAPAVYPSFMHLKYAKQS